MADQTNPSSLDLRTAAQIWNDNLGVRNELANRAGQPDTDNVDIKWSDPLKAAGGSALTSVGGGVKEISLGDLVHAARNLPSAVADGVSSVADKAVEQSAGNPFLQNMGMTPQQMEQAIPTDNGIREAGKAIANSAPVQVLGDAMHNVGEAVQTGADYADKAIKPVAKAVGGVVYDAGKKMQNWVSPEGQKALNSQLYTEDQDGLHVGDAWGDPGKLAMKFSDAIGSLGGTLATSYVTGGMAKQMVMRSMLKRGASEAVARDVAERAGQHWAERAAVASGVSMSTGQTADQARQSFQNVSDEDKLNSPTFVDTVQAVHEQFPELDPQQRMDIVNQRMGDKLASEALSDPTTYAAAAAGTLMGDAMIAKMVNGGGAAFTGNLVTRMGKAAGKGVVGEGIGEATEQGLQQNVQNRADNAVAGTHIDPMQDVARSAVEAGTLGVMTGGFTGSLGGIRSEGAQDSTGQSQTQNAQNASTPPQSTPSVSAQVQSAEVPDIVSAIKEVSANPVPGAFSIGRDTDGFRGIFIDQNGKSQLTKPFDSAEEVKQAISPFIQTNDQNAANNIDQVNTEQQSVPQQSQQQTPEQASVLDNQRIEDPAYLRRGNMSDELRQTSEDARRDAAIARNQKALADAEYGVLRPHENTVTGNPDEPAFLRTAQNNPTGRDLSGQPDVNPLTDVQQRLAQQQSAPTPDELIRNSVANGDQGKTPQEDFVVGDYLPKQAPVRPQTEQPGVTVDGDGREVIPESNQLTHNGVINMPGQAGDGVNSEYVPPVTANRVTADQSLGQETIRDPRTSVGQSIQNAGQQSDAIFDQLKSLRVTRKGKPFGTEKEAQMASRKTETPIALPDGGFGVVDKSELARVKETASNPVEKTEMGANGTNGVDINSASNESLQVAGTERNKTEQALIDSQDSNQDSQGIIKPVAQPSTGSKAPDVAMEQQTDPAISQKPWTKTIEKPDGTMVMEGDTKQLKSWAKDNGITAISHQSGIVVGRSSAAKAREIINQPDRIIRTEQKEKTPGTQRSESKQQAERSDGASNGFQRPINDFGQKIRGAKKDLWKLMKEQMSGKTAADIKELPLSKAWPEPDYQKMHDNGMDKWVIAFIRAARESIPAKPKLAHKIASWAEHVRTFRDLSIDVADGHLSGDDLKNKIQQLERHSRYAGDLMGRADLYAAVGHSRSLADLSLNSGNYSLFNGVQYNPSKVIWSVQRKPGSKSLSNWPTMLTYADTRQKAIEQFSKLYPSLPTTEDSKSTVSFDIFSGRHDRTGFYVGKKIGRNPALLAGPFETIKEAREYKLNNQKALEEKLAKYKEIPLERRDVNNPRVGEDMRGGVDVTPETFADTFGFRGVQFGNWVEQSTRQDDLNSAYDALMDMAAILNVPPKALSLNGELGIAFGARGTGGVSPASAHYEHGHVVINLTKRRGAGALGHEWWHALDSYFSRARQPSSGQMMMTESRDVGLASRGSNFINQNPNRIRTEMIKAFGDVVGAVHKTAMEARSSKLDAKRTKDYWTTEPEMSARAFESYLVSKLQDNNASNDYLANIVAPDNWSIAEKNGLELDSSYPYPTAGEIPLIRAGFDHFFSTLKYRDSEGGKVALFSRQPKQNSIGRMSPREVDMATKEWLKQFKTNLNVEVAANQDEFNRILERHGYSYDMGDDEIAGASYLPGSDTVVINSETISNPAQLRQFLRHEVMVHYGLSHVAGPDTFQRVFQAIMKGYTTSDEIRNTFDKVAALYKDDNLMTKMEEVFAHYAENHPVENGPVARLWDTVKRIIKSALVKVGFMKQNEAEAELDSLLRDIASNMRRGVEFEQDVREGSDTPKFSKSSTVDNILESAFSKLGLEPKPDFLDKTKSNLDKLKQADSAQVKSWIQKVAQKSNIETLDDLASIKYHEDATGKNIDASESAYIAARMSRGSSTVMNATMLYGLPEWHEGVIRRKPDTDENDAMLGIFSGLGKDLNHWLMWMAGHRAGNLMKEGRENLFTPDEIEAMKGLNRGKEKQFEAARQKWKALNNAVLDLAEKSGLIDPNSRSQWESEWYVPFFRDNDDGDVTAPYRKRGIANQSAGVRLKGGTANVHDLLENIFNSTSRMIDASMKNMAALRAIHNLGDTDLMSINEKPNLMDLRSVKNPKSQTFSVKMDGKDILVTVNDPELFRAMTMISSVSQPNTFVKMGMFAKHLLTAGVTTDPAFMLRNFLRDAVSAWMMNKDGFKPVIDSARGVLKSWKMDPTAIDMMFAGASFQGGNLRGNDPHAMASAVRKALRAKGFSPEQIDEYQNSLIGSAKAVKEKLGHYLEKYEQLGESVENGSRVAIYEAALKAGKSKAQAAFEARDLMDFSMSGASSTVKFLINVLPFFNARMQGLGKLGRAFQNNPKQIAMRGGMIAAASLALLAANWDDKRYNQLPDWDKDNNWHFWMGDQHFRIPKPFELGLLFGTLPERMIRTAGGVDTTGKLGREIGSNLWSTIEINPIPQVVRPLMEAYLMNKNTFTWAPIENMSDQNLEPRARYNEQTSLTMRALGDALNMSPKKLEYAWRGYTGTIGAYVMAISDALVRQAGNYGETPTMRADQIPLLSSVYQGSAPARNTQDMQDFYALLDDAMEAKQTFNHYLKNGDPEKAREMLADPEDKANIRKAAALNGAQQSFRALRNQIEMVRRDKLLDGDQKTERINRILARRNDLASKLVQRFGPAD